MPTVPIWDLPPKDIGKNKTIGRVLSKQIVDKIRILNSSFTQILYLSKKMSSIYKCIEISLKFKVVFEKYYFLVLVGYCQDIELFQIN